MAIQTIQEGVGTSIYEPPSYSTAVTVVPKTLVAPFGDSYTQRSRDGMNTMPQTWNVTWEKIDVTLANALMAFFDSMAGCDAFKWEPYREEGTTRKFICTNWNRRFMKDSVDAVYATFVEVFDND